MCEILTYEIGNCVASLVSVGCQKSKEHCFIYPRALFYLLGFDFAKKH